MYYALPTDFLGLRDIEIADPSDVRKTTTLHFVTPEQMNLVTSTQNTEQLVSVGAIYYSIVADQLQIFPTSSNLILEVVYYVRVPDLTPTAANNWVSDDHSDLYLFGVLTEISAWVKDQAATQLWDTRFRAALDDLRQDDAKARWSGPPLIMRTT
jgi:hypothetical protein